MAKLLGLPYPGGPIISRLALEGNRQAIAFPRAWLAPDSLDFSFSGVKTSVANHVNACRKASQEPAIPDICASFQEAVCHVLAAKTETALRQTGATRLVVAGGVACNSGLRSRMKDLCAKSGVELFIPHPSLCGDNAAMLAVPGDYYLSNGHVSSLSLDVTATWDMDSIKESMS